MDGLPKETQRKGNGQNPPDPGRNVRVKFGLFGEEMIEKVVKPRGSTGGVYLPSDWVGKLVKIIRID